MIRYAATIFVSAFLLFLVQPMVARFILPWFGGSSLVWTTCMLFFQVSLVFGYAYSHFITRRLTPTQQWGLHTLLLFLAVLLLPIKPYDYWKPTDSAFPTLRILTLLSVSVGLPFFLLATTGPLIQAWQGKTHPDRSPFRLFALSNFASLAALLSYPFFFERYFTLNAQSWAWSLTFFLFAILAFLSGRQFCGGSDRSQQTEQAKNSHDVKPAKIGWVRLTAWLLLPMLASIQLLATTNLMTQEIGSLPFLWIVPLSLYLISFVICFDHQRWYVRPLFFGLFFGAAIYSGFVLEAGIKASILAQVIGYTAVCFGASMCCHGELARMKPGVDHLTMFYLLIAIGGALGGLFVAVVAPQIFIGYYEFQLGMILVIVCALLAYVIEYRSQNPSSEWGARTRCFSTVLVGLVAVFFVGGSFATEWKRDHEDWVLHKSRNAYGTLKVSSFDTYVSLANGRTIHGMQPRGTQSKKPTSYYGPRSGLGLAIEWMRDKAKQDSHAGIDFGAIGLGVGTICGWCEPHDTLRFFEINPAVQEIAQVYFTYLDSCSITPEIVLGDARLQLEREVNEEDARHYDVLIADAFFSDSIPIHLLTLESMQIYKSRLKPNGILAFHVSNRFLRLENIVKLLAREIGMDAVIVEDYPSDDSIYDSSKWVLVTQDLDFIGAIIDGDNDGDWPDEKTTARWTDDYASIVPVIRWEQNRSWLSDLLKTKGWAGDSPSAEVPDDPNGGPPAEVDE
jgi:hypothetical protein